MTSRNHWLGSRPTALVALALVSTVLLASCQTAATPTPVPPAPSLVPAADTPPPPPPPTTAPTAEPPATRIAFAAGDTSAVVVSTLAAGATDYYVLSARSGQLMTVMLKSPDSSVILEVAGLSDGQALLASDVRQTEWQGTLPASQDYRIKAVSTAGETYYALQVTIPATDAPTQPEATRIEFAPGATSAVVQGALAAGATDQYVLRALADQQMTVTVSSPANSVVLEIVGVSEGQPLLRSHSLQTSWQGTLPSSQDYSVKVVSTRSVTSYSLQVSIPAAEPPPPTPEGSRIEFAPGATSAVVDGSLDQAATDEYVLRALAGQWMIAMVFSPDNSVVLDISGLTDGQPLVRSDLRQPFWQGSLPATQDYSVKAVSTTDASVYTLQVIIPERVEFATGAISATRQGSLEPWQTHDYLLRALQGQTMTVTIQSPDDQVLLEIYGIDDGQPLARVPMGLTTWTGELPNTQDYAVKAVRVSETATSYEIEFTIQ
jgi:hypothetical protein